MKSAAKLLLLLLALLLGTAAGRVAVLAQGQAKAQKSAKPHDTKNRSFFAGAKPVAASGSTQQGLTATGGTKGAVGGKEIGEAQPTAADRAMVGAMENYSIPEADLKQFQDEGKLIPAK
jgi:hypothetical protein